MGTVGPWRGRFIPGSLLKAGSGEASNHLSVCNKEKGKSPREGCFPGYIVLPARRWVGASRKGETPPKEHIPLPQSHPWALDCSPRAALPFCLIENRSPNWTQISLLRSAGVCARKRFALFAPFYSLSICRDHLLPEPPTPSLAPRGALTHLPPHPMHRDPQKRRGSDAAPALPSRPSLGARAPRGPPAGGVNYSRSPSSFPRRLFQQAAGAADIKNLPLPWWLSIELSDAEDGCPAAPAARADEVSRSRRC